MPVVSTKTISPKHIVRRFMVLLFRAGPSASKRFSDLQNVRPQGVGAKGAVIVRRVARVGIEGRSRVEEVIDAELHVDSVQHVKTLRRAEIVARENIVVDLLRDRGSTLG